LTAKFALEKFNVSKDKVFLYLWSYYFTYGKVYRYRIRRITVKLGEAISLQLHYQRSEHWIVIKGIVKFILEDENG